MSASPPMISMSDKEDACICEHKVTLVKAKCMKEEQQRQWEEEAQWAEEAEKAQREAKAKKGGMWRPKRPEKWQRWRRPEERLRRKRPRNRKRQKHWWLSTSSLSCSHSTKSLHELHGRKMLRGCWRLAVRGRKA